VASSGFLVYGLKVHSSVRQLDDKEKRTKVIWRLNLVIFVCTCCCMLRLIMAILLYLNNWGGETTTLAGSDSLLALWLLLSQWIPHFGLAVTMLYVTRRPEDEKEFKKKRKLAQRKKKLAEKKAQEQAQEKQQQALGSAPVSFHTNGRDPLLPPPQAEHGESREEPLNPDDEDIDSGDDESNSQTDYYDPAPSTNDRASHIDEYSQRLEQLRNDVQQHQLQQQQQSEETLLTQQTTHAPSLSAGSPNSNIQ